jgi:hypothetical protein
MPKTEYPRALTISIAEFLKSALAQKDTGPARRSQDVEIR